MMMIISHKYIYTTILCEYLREYLREYLEPHLLEIQILKILDPQSTL